MPQLKFAITAGPSVHEQALVRLFQVSIVLADEGRSGINGSKVAHFLLHLFFEHDVADIFHVLETLSLKMERDMINELFFDPDEDHTVFHD